MQQAIEFEIKRQIEILEEGGKVVQETRLYDPDKNETRPMRSKEDAMDYRYFPDPDLLPLVLSQHWLDEVKAALPELPQAMREKFMREYELSAYDAVLLTASKELAVYFDAIARHVDPKLAANWITGELSSRLNDQNIAIADSPVKPEALIWLIGRIIDGTISGKIAKDVFRDLWDGKVVGAGNLTLPAFKVEADRYIEKMGLQQISDRGEIEKIVDQVIAANAQQIAAYRSGKPKAFNSLVGQVMKATKGKANPGQVNELLKRKLAE
jgi:aspartyl-tRNA(Asn)/glutamyl-tRNA(Gln) amidotransferase subunit B